jgi:hypothetical protein
LDRDTPQETAQVDVGTKYSPGFII